MKPSNTTISLKDKLLALLLFYGVFGVMMWCFITAVLWVVR